MEDATGSKAKLLAATVEYVADNGVGEMSLRRLAAALGTSHRMLIYHFGSKEGLLVEVVRTVEQRQRDAFGELVADVGDNPEQIMRRFWDRLADPELSRLEKLFFELYGQALQGYPGTTTLLEGIVDSWLEPLVDSVVRQGFPPEEARVNARLGLAVTRGLLLDLLATGDRTGVYKAFDRFVTMFLSTARSTGPNTATDSAP